MPVGCPLIGIIPTKPEVLEPGVSAFVRLNTATFPLSCMATKADLPSRDGTTCSASRPPLLGSELSEVIIPDSRLLDPEHRHPAAAGDKQVLPVVGQCLPS